MKITPVTKAIMQSRRRQSNEQSKSKAKDAGDTQQTTRCDRHLCRDQRHMAVGLMETKRTKE